jgi:DHA2 family multidrug resistance protein-like MFS transporter
MNTNAHSPWNALPALLAGAVMVVLDFFIVNVALPSIAVDLHASASSLIWVVAAMD